MKRHLQSEQSLDAKHNETTTFMFDSCDTWSVIYNARSNRCHPPMSPIIVPATKMTTLMIDPCHMWNVIYNGRSNRQNPPTSPNIASAHSKIWQKFVKTAETWFTVRGRAEHDPRMIRPWAQSAIRSATEVTFRARHEHFVLKEKDFPLRLSFQNLTCACHEKWQLNFTKYCFCQQKWHCYSAELLPYWTN